MSRAGAESLRQPLRSAYLSKAVPNANPYDRHWKTAADYLGHGAAQTAQNIVIFGRDDAAGLAGGIQNRLFIQRFNTRHIDHAG
jgi:hypothetical protein